MAADLTTLQVARRVADAAVAAAARRDGDDWTDPPTQAVLRALRETGSWLCRLDEDDVGIVDERPYDQLPLFR